VLSSSIYAIEFTLGGKQNERLNKTGKGNIQGQNLLLRCSQMEVIDGDRIAMNLAVALDLMSRSVQVGPWLGHEVCGTLFLHPY